MRKVSVCIPAYNGQDYVSKSVESVLQQSFSDWELVICDDASTDETPDICRSFQDRRIRYLRFDRNGGQAVNWNRCLEAAAGEYIVLLHQDDMLAPTYLGRAVEVLDRHSSVGLVHCSVQHVDANGNPILLQRTYEADRVQPGEALWRELVVRGCVVNPAGVMVRKAAYRVVGPFTTRIHWGIDWHMWIRIAIRFEVAYLTDTLAFYREHAQSGTGAVAAAARNGPDELWVIEDTFEHIGATRPELLAMRGEAVRQVAHRTWCLAETMCQRGVMPPARAGLRRAVKIWPGMLLQSRLWGLWAATYIGYDWFRRMQHRRASLSLGVRSRPGRAASRKT